MCSDLGATIRIQQHVSSVISEKRKCVAEFDIAVFSCAKGFDAAQLAAMARSPTLIFSC
jgi:hypothetical protein